MTLAHLPTATPTNPRAAAALAYASRGLRIVRLHGTDAEGGCLCGDSSCRSPGKHPSTGGTWIGTTTAETIDRWWRAAPESNVGLVAGEMADGRNLVVIDVDGPGGEADLVELERDLAPLPATWIARTGRPDGGRHLYFSTARDGLTNAKLGSRRKIDTRAGGRGYVVAPPSRHASGVTYAWQDGRSPDDLELAELPEAWEEHLARPALDREASAVAPPTDASISPRVADLIESNKTLGQYWRGVGKRKRD